MTKYKAALIPILNKLPILEPDSNKIKEDDESDEKPDLEDIAEILLSDGVAMAIERGEGENLPSLSGVEITSWCRNNIPEWDKKISSFIASNKEDLEKILADVKDGDDWVSSTVNSPSKAQDNAYTTGEEIVAKEFMTKYILECGIEITATAEQVDRWNNGDVTDDDAKEMIIHLPGTSRGLPVNLDLTIAEFEKTLEYHDDILQQKIIEII